MHTLQFMDGCQWDDESGDVDGSDQHGYDGEDWISLDLNNRRYIESNQWAVLTKNKWDNRWVNLNYLQFYYTQYCIGWLKKYLQYGNSTLGRTGTAAHNTDNCI